MKAMLASDASWVLLAVPSRTIASSICALRLTLTNCLLRLASVRRKALPKRKAVGSSD